LSKTRRLEFVPTADDYHALWAELGMIVIDISRASDRIQKVRERIKRMENSA